MRILIVGAGFAGATYARILAEAGHDVFVIERRPHIGGNAYDFVDERGVRVHAYGPHLFHTKNDEVLRWLKQFGVFVPYRHRVRVRLPDERLAPLPINIDTLRMVFDTPIETAEEARALLARVALPIEHPRNAAEYLNARIGPLLTDLFFRDYTRKMWNLELEDLSEQVVRRIPIRYDSTDTYFPEDETQILPRDGYTSIFERILDHERIVVQLEAPFSSEMAADFDHTFNSMAIDEFFDFRFGELPYRSIKFASRAFVGPSAGGVSVINFTGSRPETRETYWHELPNHRTVVGEVGTATAETPCDYKDNRNERYYPVRTSDDRYRKVYLQYAAIAKEIETMTFIGRCGTYQYLDMDQVINQSLAGAVRWLDANGRK